MKTEKELIDEIDTEFAYFRKMKDPYEMATLFVNLCGTEQVRAIIQNHIKDHFRVDLNKAIDQVNIHHIFRNSDINFLYKVASDLRRARERTQRNILERMMLE